MACGTLPHRPGRHEEALAIYDDKAWGVAKDYSQDQIGAVSLLARLELAGADVGDALAGAADYLAARVHDQVLPFLDMQYLYGLARAGRPQADTLLRAIEDFAPRAPEFTRDAWQRSRCRPPRPAGARAGEFAPAADSLREALPRLEAIGGSHAQRDLFEQILIDALLRSGKRQRAHALLRPRADAAPQSVRLRRQLAAGAG